MSHNYGPLTPEEALKVAHGLRPDDPVETWAHGVQQEYWDDPRNHITRGESVVPQGDQRR